MEQSLFHKLIENVRAEARSALSEIESKQILEAIGIATTMPRLAQSAAEASSLARQIGFPVAVKIASPELSHKSEVGGVELALPDEREVEAAFDRIRTRLKNAAPDARFMGVTVQPMAPLGIEMLAGIARDPQFGPLVMVAMGGIMVEVLADTAMRLAPIGAAEASAMIEELKGAPILRGARGGKPADAGALSALLVKLAELALLHPEIKEMDLNPVTVYSSGLRVLDARVMLDTEPHKDAERERSGMRAARIENLRRAFSPATVAVIGDKRMGGYMWLRAEAKFGGKLYSVQIDPNEIAGIEAMGVTNYKTLAEITEPIDYAITAVPRQVASRILKDCIACKVRAVTFFTSGFSETGEELGVKLESELKALAGQSDIALIGPNCMGLYNPAAGLCNFPDEKVGEGGDVCFISQSGTHTINFCLQAPSRGIRVNKAASIGNAIVLEAADYIDVLAADPHTRAIGIYIEGVRDGRRFFESLGRAASRHPVVVWKGGATEAGAKAAFSHTASLAAPDKVWKAAMRQSGAVEVASFDAMLDALELLSRGRMPKGKRMGLVAMTGGQSVVITDTFARAGLAVPALSAQSYEQLKQFFNIIGGSYRNPLDAGGTIGMGHDQRNLDRILEILESDRVLDAIVLEISTGLRAARWERHQDELTGLLAKLAEFNNRCGKAFALIMHPAHVETIVAQAKQLARSQGLVVFESFERAAAAFAAAADYWTRRPPLTPQT